MNINIKTVRIFVLDALLIEVGLMISSLGTSLFYSAETGSSAMATFCDGLHLLIGTSYGNANMAANVVFLIALLFLDWKLINIGTLLCVFTIGPWQNVFMPILAPLNIASMSYVARVAFSAVGAAFMGLGLGLYMSRERGFGALEGVVKYINKKFGFPVNVTKIAQDVILTGLGVLLGAKWGIGTIVGIFLIGPILSRANDFFKEKIKY